MCVNKDTGRFRKTTKRKLEIYPIIIKLEAYFIEHSRSPWPGLKWRQDKVSWRDACGRRHRATAWHSHLGAPAPALRRVGLHIRAREQRALRVDAPDLQHEQSNGWYLPVTARHCS